MKIISLDILINEKVKKKFDLSNEWTFITSNGKNSQGKSTIVRALIYGMGFILKKNFVNGTHIKKLKTEITFDNGLKIARDDFSIRFMKSGYVKFLPLTKKNHLGELVNEYNVIFENDWEFISSFLFANYSDQQYGFSVINRGKTGPFPKFFDFSIEKLTASLSDTYNAKKLLEKEKKRLLEYEINLDFIRKNVDVESDQMNMELSEVLETSTKLQNLKSRIVLLNNLKEKHESRISMISAFENNIPKLNLIYRDQNNVDHKLTASNFRDNIAIQKNVISKRISELKNQVNRLEEKMLELKKYVNDDKENLPHISSLVEIIKKNRIRISESKFKSFQDTKKAIENKIEKIQNKLSLKQFDEISIHMNKYLNVFSKMNSDIKLWLEKFNKNQYANLLDVKSKFVTYAGAIRFIIAASFKFAMSQYLWSKNIKLPIIIDEPFPKGIAIEIKKRYLKILGDLPQSKIIASIDKRFIKLFDAKPKYGDVVVTKDLFESGQLSIFSTIE